MTIHTARMAAIAGLVVLAVIYPFLPGAHDRLAVPLSTMAQTMGLLGAVFVAPVGGVWLGSEIRSRRGGGLSGAARYRLGVAAMIAASLVALAVSVVALAGAGLALALATLALWLWVSSRLLPGLRRLRNGALASFHAAPAYLVLLPVTALLAQLALAAPLTAFSRGRAVARAAELIADLEDYRAREGRYPPSLSAVHADYHPSVIGIDRFRYAPNGAGYDLSFEQPRFLLDDIGTRELVVYNPLDRHLMPGHAAWILRFTPEQLESNQGWYAVHEGPRPHWKSFRFD